MNDFISCPAAERLGGADGPRIAPRPLGLASGLRGGLAERERRHPPLARVPVLVLQLCRIISYIM